MRFHKVSSYDTMSLAGQVYTNLPGQWRCVASQTAKSSFRHDFFFLFVSELNSRKEKIMKRPSRNKRIRSIKALLAWAAKARAGSHGDQSIPLVEYVLLIPSMALITIYHNWVGENLHKKAVVGSTTAFWRYAGNSVSSVPMVSIIKMVCPHWVTRHLLTSMMTGDKYIWLGFEPHLTNKWLPGFI